MANYACGRMDEGALDEADAALVESLRLSGRHDGLAPAAAVGHFLRASCLCHMGRYAQGVAQAELALDMMQRHQPGGVRFAQLRLGTFWWHLGQGARLAQMLASVGVDEQASVSERALHARLAWHYAHDHRLAAQRDEARAAMVAVMGELGPTRRPDLFFAVQVDVASADEPARGMEALQAVAAQAERQGYLGALLAAQVRCAALAAEVDAALARRCAQRALELHARGRWSNTLLPGELWLHATRAFAAAGEAAEARRVLDQGLAWLRSTAQEHVPEAFRDGFLHRNPVNREIIALDARLPAAE